MTERIPIPAMDNATADLAAEERYTVELGKAIQTVLRTLQKLPKQHRKIVLTTAVDIHCPELYHYRNNV